jgi:branched-chain amino acid aminotransferase
LLTPEGRNCLRGTRRTYLLELAGHLGIDAREANIELYDVVHADEAFFSSTAFSMLPCTRINGMPIGDGAIGPIFKRLIDSWSEEVGVDIISQTRTFAAEVGAATSGTSMYRFAKQDTPR